MDYHSDRFTDYSLLIFKDDSLFAVLPAHITETTVYSHLGLTYGGLVLQTSAKLFEVIEAFKEVLLFLHNNSVTNLYIKVIPDFYVTHPSGELPYVLFRANASLVKRDVIFLIDYKNRIAYQKKRRTLIRKTIKSGLLEIRVENKFDDFWNKLLIPNLEKKHGVKPVHTLVEMKLLASRFPDNIKQVNVYHDGQIVAGTTMFITKTTLHPQYISGNADKNKLGSLDFLYDYLINEFMPGKEFFDFNISSENSGQLLNSGLVFWKESLGARSVIADNYEVATENYKLLDTIPIR